MLPQLHRRRPPHRQPGLQLVGQTLQTGGGPVHSIQPSDTCPQVGGRAVLEWSVEHVSRDMEAASLVREAALQHEVSI